jgi:hypothetical protein
MSNILTHYIKTLNKAATKNQKNRSPQCTCRIKNVVDFNLHMYWMKYWRYTPQVTGLM